MMGWIKTTKTTIISRAICLILIALFGWQTQAQTVCPDDGKIQLILPDREAGLPGDIVCVDLKAKDFTNFTIFVFSINFNSTVLRFVSADPLVSGLPSFSRSDIIDPFPPDNLDIIRVLWAQPNVQGETLADSTTLMRLCFEIIGNPGQEGVVHINSSGLSGLAEFVTPDGITEFPCLPGDGTQIEVLAPFSALPTGFITSTCGTTSGLSEGLIEISIFNGTPPYTVFDGSGNRTDLPPGQNVFIDRNLNSGSHTYLVSDANGDLSNPITVTVGNSPPFDVEASLVEPDCPLENDGRILLNVSGGVPYDNGEYFYDWGMVQVGLGQNELRNLTNGTYPVAIMDSLGCVQRDSFILMRQDIGVEVREVRDALCASRANGLIRVSASGGEPFNGDRYIFTIEGITDDGQLYLDSRDRFQEAIFSNLPPGQYDVVIQDSVDRRLNCPGLTSFTIGTQRTLTTSIITGNNTGCGLGSERAEISINSTDLVNFPLMVQIIDTLGVEFFNGPVNASPYITDCLPQGEYRVFIDDPEGCEVESTFSLMGCALVVLDTIITPISCSGDTTGSIIVTADSDNLPLSFQWNTGDTTNTISDLSSGTYSVTISDQADCELELSFVINDPLSFSLTFDSEPILCRGQTGNVIAMPTGGTAPYQYAWAPDPSGTTGSILANVTTGTYAVTITDQNGCTVIDSFILTEPGSFNVEVTNVNPPVCEGESTGTAIINAFATPDYSPPFSYLASTGLRGNGANFSVDNFPAGRNWVIASDGICTSDTVYIDVPAQTPIQLDRDSSVIPDLFCYGSTGNDGVVVNLRGIGGNGTPISFEWPDLGPGVTGNVQVDLGAGTYTVIMTNVSGCTSTDSIIITQPDSLQARIDSLNSIFALCGGDNNTELVVVHQGGIENGQFTYRWEDANGNLIASSATASNLVPGTYMVTVTDENACTAVITTDVTEPEPVVGVLGEVLSPLCFEDLGEINVDSAFGGIPDYRYQVNTSPAMDISEPFDIIPGTHTVRIFDQNGCQWDTTLVINSAEELSINAGPDREIGLGGNTNLRVEISNVTPIDTIIWMPDQSLQCVLSNCQEVDVSPSNDQVYTVIVRDINGCTATDEVRVSLSTGRSLYIPNVFSPDAQNTGNALFKFFAGPGIRSIDFIRIYDRWGQLVYEELNAPPSPNGSGGWDGRFKGQELLPGVYVYVGQVTYVNNEKSPLLRGDITLIR